MSNIVSISAMSILTLGSRLLLLAPSDVNSTDHELRGVDAFFCSTQIEIAFKHANVRSWVLEQIDLRRASLSAALTAASSEFRSSEAMPFDVETVSVKLCM